MFCVAAKILSFRIHSYQRPPHTSKFPDLRLGRACCLLEMTIFWGSIFELDEVKLDGQKVNAENCFCTAEAGNSCRRHISQCLFVPITLAVYIDQSVYIGVRP